MVSVDIFPKPCLCWKTSKRLYHVVYPCLSPTVIFSFQLDYYFYSYSLGEHLHLIKDEIYILLPIDYNGSNYYSYFDIRGFEWESNDTVFFAKALGNCEVIYE